MKNITISELLNTTVYREQYAFKFCCRLKTLFTGAFFHSNKLMVESTTSQYSLQDNAQWHIENVVGLGSLWIFHTAPTSLCETSDLLARIEVGYNAEMI